MHQSWQPRIWLTLIKIWWRLLSLTKGLGLPFYKKKGRSAEDIKYKNNPVKDVKLNAWQIEQWCKHPTETGGGLQGWWVHTRLEARFESERHCSWVLKAACSEREPHSLENPRGSLAGDVGDKSSASASSGTQASAKSHYKEVIRAEKQKVSSCRSENVKCASSLGFLTAVELHPSLLLQSSFSWFFVPFKGFRDCYYATWLCSVGSDW